MSVETTTPWTIEFRYSEEVTPKPVALIIGDIEHPLSNRAGCFALASILCWYKSYAGKVPVFSVNSTITSTCMLETLNNEASSKKSFGKIQLTHNGNPTSLLRLMFEWSKNGKTITAKKQFCSKANIIITDSDGNLCGDGDLQSLGNKFAKRYFEYSKNVDANVNEYIKQYILPERSQSAINQEDQAQRTATRLTDIDLKSVHDFLEASRSAKSGIFFNVNVSMEEWFQQNLQLHLAIQDSLTLSNRVHWLSEKSKIKTEKKTIESSATFMPFRRIMFSPKTRSELLDSLNDGQNEGKHLAAFIMLHVLMGCRLGLVTVDQLCIIIKKNAEFFKNILTEKALGIPAEICDLLTEQKVNISEVQSKLARSLKSMESSSAGEIKPSPDFALFEIAEKQNIVWCGAVTGGGALKYYDIEVQHNNLNNDGLKIRYECTLSEVKNQMCEFSRILSEEVFPDPSPKCSDLSQEIRSYMTAYVPLHPLSKLCDEIDEKINLILGAAKKYCPIHLLAEYRDNMGQLQTGPLAAAIYPSKT